MAAFSAVVELFTKTGTGLRVPAEVVQALGERRRVPVVVTIGGHSYRSTVAPYGDEYYLPLSRTNRQAAGVEAGETVEVGLELDTEPRSVTVPDDFAAALARSAPARTAFERLSYSHQREYVEWITDAKRDETRMRRVGQAVTRLEQGKTRR